MRSSLQEKPPSSSSSKSKFKDWGSLGIVLLFAVCVGAASAFTFWKYLHGFHSKNHHLVTGPPTTVDRKYADAVGVSMQFFDVQKSGRLENNQVSWRGDSGLGDGNEVNLDLSKGMYDAGDNMKFGFPMAFTATILSWSILEYGNHMDKVKELQHALDSLKWITDFLINAHPSDNVLYIQVGDPDIDHKCWVKPEKMTENRPLTQINTSYPGTDVAAETAAAMAAASLVYRSTDPSYSKTLLNHAENLFSFADNYRGLYSISIPQVGNYYNSSGYGDELLWAASWLFHATKDEKYLKYVSVENGNKFANWGSSEEWFTWDNKLAGVHVLLSRVNFFGSQNTPTEENLGLQMYRENAETFLCSLLPDSQTATQDRTQGGLLWVSKWNSLQYSVASAFLAVVYSDYMFWSQTSTLYCNGGLFRPNDLRNFAISQAEYILGENPMEISYLIGYGSDYPQYVHHRGASIPLDSNTGCTDGFKWLNSTAPNPNVAIGALVGGPFLNDTYIDARNNSMQAEPTTYNSALIIGLLSGLLTFSSSSPSFA